MDPPQLPALDNVVNFDLSTLNLRDISPTFIFQDIPFMEIPAVPSTSQQAPNQSMQSPNPEFNPRPAVQMRPPMVTYYPKISNTYFPVLIQSPDGYSNWMAPPMHQEVYHPWNICPTIYEAPVSNQDMQQMVWQKARDMEGQDRPNMEVRREKTFNSPEISPSILDEETLKDRAFEEYNTIMDSLQIEEPQTEDKWLEELYKDDEKFLQYLEQLCSDSDFVRNVGSTLNVDFWSSIMSEDPNPLELYGLEENHQQKQQIQPNVYSTSVTLAEASPSCPEPQKSNENSHFDDISPEVLNKAVDLLLQAVSEIPDPPQSPATVEENNEAQMNGEDTTSSPSQDLATSSREIVSWSELDAQIQAAFHPSTPTYTPPKGSPLLPSNQLATPDNATLSNNFDEAILLNFSSPPDSIANSTPPCSDHSIDLDTMAEMLLREDINEDSYIDLELAQPQSLSTLALKAVLNFEPAKEDANEETVSQKSNLPDYEVLSIDFGSVLQSCDNGEAHFEGENPKSEVCKDLAQEMEEELEVSQSLNQEVVGVEETQVTESKDEWKCFEIASERKLVRRSLRLSLQMQKSDETQEIQSFEETTVESFKNGDGDCKIVKKMQERGRSEDRKRKIEDSPNVDFGRYRTRSAGDLKILPNLRPRGRSQNQKQSPKQEVLEFQTRENGGKVSPVKRHSQYGGDFKESLSDNFESQEKKAKLRSARGGYGESKIETRLTRKLKIVEAESRKMACEKEKKVVSNIYKGRTRIQRKYQDFVTGKTNNVRRSQRRKCRRNC